MERNGWGTQIYGRSAQVEMTVQRQSASDVEMLRSDLDMVLEMRRLGIAVLLAGVLSLAGCVTTNVNYGTISTFAGSPGGGYSGDGGQATAAKMQSPAAVAVDAAGNVYISDAGANVVRRVTPAGVISTVAGTGVAGFTADGGQATAAQLNQPEGIAIDSANNLYIAESGNNLVRRVLSGSGVITTVVGNSAGAAAPVAGFYGDGGLATLAGVNHPFGVALDAAGNLYVSDTVNNRIRKVTAGTGIISTIAGNGGSGLTGDGGAATSATMYNPEGLLVASDGSIYVAEEANSVIRRIQSNGTISTFAGSTKYGFQGDGQAATSAQLDGPTAVAMDAGGVLYFTDETNSRVRRVATDGTIETAVGDGALGFSGDGSAGINAALNRPRGLVIAPGGTMYIADTNNNVVRKVTP